MVQKLEPQRHKGHRGKCRGEPVCSPVGSRCASSRPEWSGLVILGKTDAIDRVRTKYAGSVGTASMPSVAINTAITLFCDATGVPYLISNQRHKYEPHPLTSLRGHILKA